MEEATLPEGRTFTFFYFFAVVISPREKEEVGRRRRILLPAAVGLREREGGRERAEKK